MKQTSKSPIRVLVIDDSYFMGRSLAHLLESDDAIKVAGFAVNGEDALHQVEQLRPDVILFDIDMPCNEGPEVISYLMAAHPIPTIILSRDRETYSRLAIRYIEHGAVDLITKPSGNSYYDVDIIRNEIIYKVKLASRIEILKAATLSSGRKKLQHSAASGEKREVVIIGASTGGPRAIETILSHFPDDMPASVIIVQHMGRNLMPLFAERLSWLSPFNVSMAVDHELLIPGRVMIAPGGCNTIIVQDGEEKRVAIAGRSKQSGDFPSIDTTMKSAAIACREGVIGVLLTGVGDDGVMGLKAIRDAGGYTITEDESTCMVYGMPKAAAEAGAADEIIPLPDIAEAVMKKLVRTQ